MSLQALYEHIQRKESFLCVGLDTLPTHLPSPFKKVLGDMGKFNKAIIEATADLVLGYKINTSFYEAWGVAGMEVMEETLARIPKDSFLIMDAKRADIGHSSEAYATAYFDAFAADALTVSPYMGKDSLAPFFRHKDKWTIVLGATSNGGHKDFQRLELKNGRQLYEEVLLSVSQWAEEDQLMFVVGGTRPAVLKKARQCLPKHFFLVPGVGAQGGDLKEVCEAGRNKHIGLIVNNSRHILYADSGEYFDEAAREVVLKYCQTMKPFLL